MKVGASKAARVTASLPMLGWRSALAACVLSGAPAATALAANPGERFCVLAVEETVGTLAIVDPHAGLVKRVALGERPHEVEVSPDGRTAYVSVFGITDYDSRIGAPGRVVASIDLATGVRGQDYPLPADLRAPHGVKLRPPRFHELFVNAEVGGDAMVVFDAATHRLLRRFPLPRGLHNFVFSRDGTALFGFAGLNGVSKIDPDSGKVLAMADVGSAVRGLAIGPDGAVLAGANGAVVELRATDLKEVRRLPAPGQGQLAYLAALADGTIVAPAMTKGGVLRFAADGRSMRFIASGATPIRTVAGPDGRVYVANVTDSHIGVLGADGAVAPAIEGVATPNGLDFGVCPGR